MNDKTNEMSFGALCEMARETPDDGEGLCRCDGLADGGECLTCGGISPEPHKDTFDRDASGFITMVDPRVRN